MKNTPSPSSELDDLQNLGDVQLWASRLALRLVGDAHLAEDVVQDALVASLESRSEVQSPRAWLAGTIRNLSANTRRDRARRERREEAASPREALPSTVETAGRLEAQEILIHALLALDEPFRSSLVARYVDGLAPRVIAERNGVPVATVNSRLARGLERLRKSLKHRHGGDESRWIAALVPLVPSASFGSGSKAAVAASGLLLKKAFLLAAAAAVVALLVPLGWRIFSAGAERALPMTPVEHVAEEDGSGGPAAAGLIEPAALAKSPAVASRRSTKQAATVAAPDGLEGAPLRLLRVLDAGSNQPVPGAVVRVMTSQRMLSVMGLGSKLRTSGDWPGANRELARRHGRRLETDGLGEVRVPTPEVGSIVIVQWGALHGTGYVAQRDEKTVVYLAPDREVEVRVVDGSGRALEGVPVRLCQEFDDGDMTKGVTAARARTRATENGASALLSLPADFWEEDGPVGWFLAVDAPLVTPVKKEVFLETWPTEPVILELREKGEVIVELRTEPGASPLGEVVQLFSFGDQESLSNSLWSAPGGVLEEGRYRFAPVGAGVPCVAVLWPNGAGLPFNAVGRGPVGASLEATIVLDPGDDGARAFGRVVTHEGIPVPGLQLDVRLLGGQWIQGGLVTDEQGRFEWRVRLDQPPYLDAEFLLHDPLEPHRSLTISAEAVRLAVHQAGSRSTGVDLGDIALPAPPEKEAVLSGRVITPEGQGVANARVQWVETNQEGDVVRRVAVLPSDLTAADGRFQVENIDRSPGVTLSVELSGNFFHEPLPFDLLQQDDLGNVLVEVLPGSVVLGSIVVDPGVPTNGIQVRAWPHASGKMPRDTGYGDWLTATLEGDGQFRLDGLRPGRYAVRAGIAEDHEFAAIVEVDALSGETQAPPIDLRGLLAHFDSRVVNAKGRKLEATVSMMLPELPASSAQGERVRYGFPEWLGTLRRGRQIVYGTRPGARLMIEAKGYFPTVVDPAEAPDEIVLLRGLDVELRMVSEAALEEAPGQLKVALTPLDVDATVPSQIRRSLAHRSPAQAVIQEGGTAKLRVPAAGEYVVQVSIDYQARSGYHIQRKLRTAEPITLTIGASVEGSAAYEVPVDAAVFAEALEYVRTTFAAWIKDGTLPPDLEFGDTHRD